MKKVIFIAVTAFAILSSFDAMAQNKTKTTITFNGGSCQITEIDLNPMWAPAGMKENEKAFSLQFKYTLDSGVDSEVVGTALYDEGQFVTADGKTYKAGAAMSNEDEFIYILTVAVPKDLDVGTLSFVLGKSKTPLKPFIKD
jgi:hypothetical protein